MWIIWLILGFIAMIFILYISFITKKDKPNPKIGDIWEFHYPKNNVTQQKILISHEDYVKSKTGILSKEEFKVMTRNMEWFTDESPLYKSIFTGILDCNGIHKCKTKLI